MNKLDKQSLNCNKVNVKVPKIIPHQQMVRVTKTGRIYTKPEYAQYKKLISLQLGKLPTIEHTNELHVKLRFNCINKRVGDIDNITKPILDTLQGAKKIKDDRYITSLQLEKTFGHKENSIDIQIQEKEIT